MDMFIGVLEQACARCWIWCMKQSEGSFHRKLLLKMNAHKDNGKAFERGYVLCPYVCMCMFLGFLSR